MRETIFAALLAAAGLLVAYGAFLASTPLGYVTSGLLLAGWAWLFLGEI